MKFSSYFFKYAKKEKKNFIASVFTFLALFASLQALLGFCTAAVRAIYFYNPAKSTSKWIFSRPVVLTIGEHVFAK